MVHLGIRRAAVGDQGGQPLAVAEQGQVAADVAAEQRVAEQGHGRLVGPDDLSARDEGEIGLAQGLQAAQATVAPAGGRLEPAAQPQPCGEGAGREHQAGRQGRLDDHAAPRQERGGEQGQEAHAEHDVRRHLVGALEAQDDGRHRRHGDGESRPAEARGARGIAMPAQEVAQRGQQRHERRQQAVGGDEAQADVGRQQTVHGRSARAGRSRSARNGHGDTGAAAPRPTLSGAG